LMPRFLATREDNALVATCNRRLNTGFRRYMSGYAGILLTGAAIRVLAQKVGDQVRPRCCTMVDDVFATAALRKANATVNSIDRPLNTIFVGSEREDRAFDTALFTETPRVWLNFRCMTETDPGLAIGLGVAVALILAGIITGVTVAVIKSRKKK